MLPDTPAAPGRGSDGSTPGVAAWTRAGLLALALHGLLVTYATRTPQPDQVADPDGWARFVTSPSYLVEHLATTVLGTVLVVLGTVALATHLASRTPRLALTGLVLAVVGAVGFTVPGVISTFTTPAIGAAHLAGDEDVMALEFPPVVGPVFALALLVTVAGNVLLGVAVWRSSLLPRWAGVLWAVASVVFHLLGAALGLATTGASLPTQPVGGALTAVAGAWLAWGLLRRPPDSADLMPSDPATSTTASPHQPGRGTRRPPQHWRTRFEVMTGSAGARPED